MQKKDSDMLNKPSKLSRRQFLKTAGATGAGIVLSHGDDGVNAAESSDMPQRVPTRPFGKTGQDVSILSLGGMFDIYNSQLLLKQAVKWGVTYWDTADCYQNGSEKGIGRYFAKYPDQRKKIFLVSKSDSRNPKGMSRLLDRSLARMNTDYLDLYFVHGVSRFDEINDEIKRWAEKTKRSGKIRFFGFSTHYNMEKLLLAAAKLDWIDGIMMTYNFRLMHTARMQKAVAACAKTGIGLTAMKTQGGGQVRTTTEAELELAGRFIKRGFTDGQAKLKAVWEHPHIASICSQMPNLTLLMSNVAAAVDKTRISQRDNELFRQFASETQSAYCAGCTDICEGAIDAAVPIGDVMRCLMYHRSYGDLESASALYRSLSWNPETKIESVDYSVAEKRCPSQLPIARLLREAAETLI